MGRDRLTLQRHALLFSCFLVLTFYSCGMRFHTMTPRKQGERRANINVERWQVATWKLDPYADTEAEVQHGWQREVPI